MKSTIPVITIDGPSGSGKGSVGLGVARALGWHFLDSGALYRVLALAGEEAGELNNEEALSKLVAKINVTFEDAILLEGRDVTDTIRSEYCGNLASKIASYPLVRTALLPKQRGFLRPPGLVADGRDMGTVVFPKAFCKIFLEASLEERAKRRYLQLKKIGQDVTLQSLLAEVSQRDSRDKQRVFAPLKPAIDAWVLDTTDKGIEEVCAEILKEVKQRLLSEH